MKDLKIDDLRALIRLIPSVQSLRQDVEKSLHLELYHRAGNLMIKSFRGLRDSIVAISDDPYIRSLDADVDDEMTDKEKAAQVLILTGQLLSYLEVQTGVHGLVGERETNIQTAPYIIVNTSNTTDKQKASVLQMVRRALDDPNAEIDEPDHTDTAN